MASPGYSGLGWLDWPREGRFQNPGPSPEARNEGNPFSTPPCARLWTAKVAAGDLGGFKGAAHGGE